MTLLQSQEAIGAVTQLLKMRMTSPSMNVTIGRPESAAKNTNAPKINLFLYRIGIDGHLRNHPLDRGQQPPIWLVLHYLMTAFDKDHESDSIDAHRLLGRGMAALQELNFLRPTDVPPNTNPDYPVLKSNPDSLKITFDDADVELLSKIMQGSDEKYRVSAAFQVRPVMILPEVEGSYAPLVKTVGPPITAGADVGTGVMVLPNLGPQLDSISPARFVAPTAASTTLTLRGTDLTGVDKAFFGSLSLMSVVSSGNEVTAILPPNATLPPGAYPVTVSRPLTVNHVLGSNAMLAHLLPKLSTAIPSSLTPVSSTDPRLSGTLMLAGDRLGGPNDSIFVGFYRNGALALMLEATGITTQDSLTVTVPPEKALPPSPPLPAPPDYLIILRVNGEQADDTVTVSWL
jgi:hypothetical protein